MFARRMGLLSFAALAGSASLLSLGLADSAMAQANGQVAADDGFDIIVTATRQSQLLSRVPVSVSAMTEETLEQKGIKSFEDVARFTPGVNFSSGSNKISIRGISSGAGAGTTGIYLDDTPIQMRGLGFSADDSLPGIFDLERVEVLRGPQGTLFGAGSEGGTVRYITPQPGLQEYSVFARGEVAQTQHGGTSYEAGLAAGGPLIVDKIGFRASAYHRRDGGWIDRVDNGSIGPANPRGTVTEENANHSTTSVFRGALAFQPFEDLLITPSFLYQEKKVNDGDAFYEGISDRKGHVFRKSSPDYNGSRDKFYLGSLNIQYDFDGVSLISNTSYFHRDNYTGYDGTIYDLSYYQELYADEFGSDAPLYPFLTPTGINQDLPYYLSPALVTNTQRNFTQEVRLQSNNPDSAISWVAGVFYQRNKQRSIEELIETGDDFFPFAFGMSLEDYFEWPMYGNDSYITNTFAIESQIAGFADVTLSLTDKLKVTAGARYAKTKFEFENFADGSQNFGRTGDSGSSSDKPFTPKLGVSYQADDDNMFYATWARGFRAGGANPPVPVDACRPSLDEFGLERAPTGYSSDRVTSIEIGSKNNLIDRRLQVAASVYNIKWTGIQQNVSLPYCGIQFTDNLGTAKSTGFDLQLAARPTNHLSMDLAVGYTDARYTSDTRFGPNRIIISAGDSLGGSPWSVAAGLQYDFAENYYIRGDYQFNSKRSRRVSNMNPRNRSYDPTNVAPDERSIVNLRAGAMFGPANVSLFVNNLFDQTPLTSRGHSGSETVLFTLETIQPRTAGITVSFRQ